MLNRKIYGVGNSAIRVAEPANARILAQIFAIVMRSVSGFAVDNQQLLIVVTLCKKRSDGFREIPSPVVTRHDHRNHDISSSCHGIYRLPQAPQTRNSMAHSGLRWRCRFGDSNDQRAALIEAISSVCFRHQAPLELAQNR